MVVNYTNINGETRQYIINKEEVEHSNKKIKIEYDKEELIGKVKKSVYIGIVEEDNCIVMYGVFLEIDNFNIDKCISINLCGLQLRETSTIEKIIGTSDLSHDSLEYIINIKEVNKGQENFTGIENGFEFDTKYFYIEVDSSAVEKLFN